MTIQLNDIRIFAHHGVMADEQTTGAWFRVSVTTQGDFTQAMTDDDLHATVNYAAMADIVKREMAIPSKLLEHAAWRIASHILNEVANVGNVEVTLHKENPPIGMECRSASVTVTL